MNVDGPDTEINLPENLAVTTAEMVRRAKLANLNFEYVGDNSNNNIVPRGKLNDITGFSVKWFPGKSILNNQIYDPETGNLTLLGESAPDSISEEFATGGNIRERLEYAKAEWNKLGITTSMRVIDRFDSLRDEGFKQGRFEVELIIGIDMTPEQLQNITTAHNHGENSQDRTFIKLTYAGEFNEPNSSAESVFWKPYIFVNIAYSKSGSSLETSQQQLQGVFSSLASNRLFGHDQDLGLKFDFKGEYQSLPKLDSMSAAEFALSIEKLRATKKTPNTNDFAQYLQEDLARVEFLDYPMAVRDTKLITGEAVDLIARWEICDVIEINPGVWELVLPRGEYDILDDDYRNRFLHERILANWEQTDRVGKVDSLVRDQDHIVRGYFLQFSSGARSVLLGDINKETQSQIASQLAKKYQVKLMPGMDKQVAASQFEGMISVDAKMLREMGYHTGNIKIYEYWMRRVFIEQNAIMEQLPETVSNMYSQLEAMRKSRSKS